MSFSERMGFVSARDVLQLDSIDDGLRSALWNAFYVCYVRPLETRGLGYLRDQFRMLGARLWLHFFNWPLDGMPGDSHAIAASIREWFFNTEWRQVYDFIEFVKNNYPDDRGEGTNDTFERLANSMLERENSGYRLVSGRVVPITSGMEIDEVQEALSTGTHLSHQRHLSTALDLLRDRDTPDYRNAIKEAVSAVEAVCRTITGNNKATLGDALKWLAGKQPEMVHPALREGLNKLYGYTSDAKGIRHALTDGQTEPSFAEAKFMLVACSAFVNFLLTTQAEP